MHTKITTRPIVVAAAAFGGIVMMLGIVGYLLIGFQTGGFAEDLPDVSASGRPQSADVFESAGEAGLRLLLLEMRQPENRIAKLREQLFNWTSTKLMLLGLSGSRPPTLSLEFRAILASDILSQMRRMPTNAAVIIVAELGSIPIKQQNRFEPGRLSARGRIGSLVGSLGYCGPDGARALTNILSSHPSTEARAAALAAMERAANDAMYTRALGRMYPDIYVPALKQASNPTNYVNLDLYDRVRRAQSRFAELYPEEFTRLPIQDLSPSTPGK